MKQDPHTPSPTASAPPSAVPWSVYQAALAEKDAQYQKLQEEYQSVLDISGRGVCRYLIQSREADISPSLRLDGGLPSHIEDLPRWHLEHDRIAPESVSAWDGLFAAIHRGDDRGQAEILFLAGGKGQRRCLLEFVSVKATDGTPMSAILSSKDITEQYERDRLQALEREALLQVARMTFPEIVAVNLTRKTYRMLQYYEGTHLGTPPAGHFQDMLDLRLANIAPADQAAFQATFGMDALLAAMEQKKPFVRIDYRRIGKNGVWHWMETTAVPVPNPYDGDKLVLAVSRNIDEQKLVEEHLSQALNTTSDLLSSRLYYDSLCNDIFPGLIYISYRDGRPAPYTGGKLAIHLGCPARELALGQGENVHPEDRTIVRHAQHRAEKLGKESYLAEYRVKDSYGSWAYIANQAVAFTDRMGAQGYVHFLTDVTREHYLTDRLRHYAEHDIMTGLLRRDFGESQIRWQLAQPGETGGILVILDMDNLKGLNDTLGHDQGDRAIAAIAKTLQHHFRKDDLVIRLGGDEFMAYLPGAGKGQSAVEASMKALIHKLSSITVGRQNEWPIHCSAGCTIEQPGLDTFDTLYRRADLALYYVKRHGKNGFAFFTSDMLPDADPNPNATPGESPNPAPSAP